MTRFPVYRRLMAASLVLLLAAPPASLHAVPSRGTIEGTVRLSERPLEGIELAFVEVGSGLK